MPKPSTATLLDQFAMWALAGYLADPSHGWPTDKAVAEACYKAAEAMMVERELH
jgi:hypothetical protein